jgi:hypothetical protein
MVEAAMAKAIAAACEGKAVVMVAATMAAMTGESE